MRQVGTLLSGRNLFRGLVNLQSRGFGFALVPISRHGKTALASYEGGDDFKAYLASSSMQAYGVASSRLALSGWPDTLAERIRLICRDVERCVELGLRGYIIEMCGSAETLDHAKSLLAAVRGSGIQVIARASTNGAQWYAPLAKMGDVKLYVDIAREFGLPGVDAPDATWVSDLSGYVAMIGATNLTNAPMPMAGFPTSMPMPLRAGDLSLDVYRQVLRVFDGVPVVLEGTPLQVDLDLPLVRELDYRVVEKAEA